MLLKSILLVVVLLLFLVNPKSRSKSKGKIKKIPPKIGKNGQSVITMYDIYLTIMWEISVGI